ncbi:MAG: PASTA domain-containing protein [Cellulomonadaceae bacterium]|nr:PASTA domain-containing protein [Cellulomonadaceae bacterium]
MGGSGARPATSPAGGQRASGSSAGGGSTRPPTTTRAAGTRTKGKGKGKKRRLIDYPRQGKRGVLRWLPSWRQMLGAFLTVGALGVGVLVAAYITTEVPSPGDFVDAQTTTVYYADQTTVMGTFGVQNRVIVASDAIPQAVKDAVVAGEDRSFYENAGINPTGILRALWTNLRGGKQQGGSSITQQYAERYYSNDTVTDYKGKLREALLAIKLDRQQDKDLILSNYLNTIYFGRDSYGIETAAKSYFGVSAKDLNVSQAALLAGVIPSPNNFDPRVSQEQAERRWNYVLDGMVTTGALTQAERDAQVFPATIEYARSDTFAGPQGYLLDMVQREILANTSVTEEELKTNGYSIVTSIDTGLQAMAVDTMTNAMPADKPANLRAALVTLAPSDGAILALYGGPDFLTVARNAVTQDQAQAGSTFKPFALAAYLEQGGSLKSKFSGANKMTIEGFDTPVRNFGNESFGTIDLVNATAHSVNTVYAQVNQEVGPDATLEVAIRAGIPATATDMVAVPSNVLGVASPHPLDMAHAYNTLAAQGMETTPFIVRSMSFLDGRLVYSGGTAPEKVFEADVMADVTYAMTQVVESRGATGTTAQEVGYPVAGKTGTSNDNRSAWFVGFTPQLTTAVALYQVSADGTTEEIAPFAGYDEITGGSVPINLWTDYMTKAMAGRDRVEFPARADVGTSNVPPIVTIPNVVGMSEAEATAALSAVGFAVDVQHANDPNVAEGLVSSTNPSGEAEKGSTVSIVVSDGPGTATVPDVTGQSEAAARSALEQAGFSVTTAQASSPRVPDGDVITTDPGAGSQAAPGSTITITVSSGPGGGQPTPTPTPSVEPTTSP